MRDKIKYAKKETTKTKVEIQICLRGQLHSRLKYWLSTISKMVEQEFPMLILSQKLQLEQLCKTVFAFRYTI
jgi:hypothetical protein